ncbi:S9 family peptidase [Altererythrobacter sp. H2]|uniref:S9 family peptidase n=1 Tax=Altererythrobacter sp. H2 TaxID=3108391 RepID=UPI000BD9233C|nr:S9 family peptidase [Altererythrobacter sp. H2]OZA94023.1 MAG: S9 family peptidase [Erythrobacter sp. 34-65-8]WRK95666.1 S9 family peptidase [Altererythrobacter sp. H2]
MNRTTFFRSLSVAALAAGMALAPQAASATAQTTATQNEEPTSVTTPAPAAPPVAEQRAHSYSHHGITISDPYNWLHDKSYPVVDDKDVLAYLEAENAWFEARMAPHKAMVDSLFEEMKGRIKEDDSTVPQKDGDFLYWSKFDEGQEYRKWYRKPVAGGPDQLLLDENQLAEGQEYFRLGALSVSQNGRFLAYSTDTNGSERYTARIKDLETGDLLPDELANLRGGLTWVANDTALVYGPSTEEWRTLEAKLHVIGTPIEQDVTLYKEEDQSFGVGVGLTAQEDWLVIATGDNETSEVRLVRADNPTGEQILVRPRQKGVEYDVDVRTENGKATLFVHTNDAHVNFRLATASLDKPGEWTTLIEGSDEFYLTGFDLYKDFYVTEGRLNGLDQIQLRDYRKAADVTPIPFPEASYDAGLGNNPEYDVSKLRLVYESMVTPDSVYDYDVRTGKLDLLKQQEIPSGYDPSLYKTERLMVTARDGTQVPVSVLMRKDRQMGGPLHLYAYGAYGYAVPPGFSTARLSLVDRGVAYAIAHIRGGDDLGRRWYLQGKLNERTNTFNDFVDAAKGLIDQGYTARGKVSASGGSAGGELMGVVVNTDPDLWGAVVAHVPFVDVLNTMLDESLPLTPGEWPEWGNPILSKQAFAYILSYSPYDQVIAQNYPPLLVTAGLNDPRVTYWEPAKWVAKLRATKTDSNELLLKTNMGAGHGGKSGRFASLYETAEEFAFILWQLGLTK